MRRKIGTCLLAVAMLLALMVPALAVPTGDAPGMYDLKAEAGYTVTPVTKDGGAITAADGFYANAEKLTVVVNDAKATSFYLVTAQNAAGVPTEENLIYIDQQNGASATFNVYPSSMEDGKTYYIFIASNDSEGALKQIASFVYYGGKTKAPSGNVKSDDPLSATDALWVLEAVAGTRTFTAEQAWEGNVKSDDPLSATDALWILEAVAGTRTLG